MTLDKRQARLAILSVTPDDPIRTCVERIDRGCCGIALVLDSRGRLLQTVTDGDVRRAMLARVDFGEPVSRILAMKSSPRPVTAPADTAPAALLVLMNERLIRQVPLLDAEERVVDMITMDDLVAPSEPGLQAVVMAGGAGVRLRPLTENLPKPMLPVGDRPLLEHTIEQLKQAGIRRVSITTHYKPDSIHEHFGDGTDFGLELSFVHEDQPLGTAGALGLLPEIDEPLLVINGDILTQVDFGAMLDFHRHHQADLTMAVTTYETQVPYGVVDCEGVRVRRLREKPKLSVFVNAGIYLLQPSIFAAITQGEALHMTELIERLVDQGKQVVSFPVREYWLDIGRPDHYQQAQEDVRRIKGN